MMNTMNCLISCVAILGFAGVAVAGALGDGPGVPKAQSAQGPAPARPRR